ncbi:MAG: right-handed parallel beta-helix repeat-containing protein [Bradyrhizobium sp.]|uniref:right-handed parallel beta-helix repeat-containing protein n=1 Tax=Bradyrhizobium sp. TaxID=376 RepID=UPI0025C66E58|nr:right-handed parallel beta-helix repeat-containing protein [Bradyrhizobium sp.]MBI5260328.1 right-handed parallel beta-helix repeat-containing protein [Bradyrhizobium sp.]
MKNLFAILFATFAAITTSHGITQAAPIQGKIWYVNQTSQTSGDGLGWKTAFQSLQVALSAATKGDEIWVASGTYYPHASDVAKSFVLKEDVAVYGGFSGRETKLDQRDFRKNVTILSGSIGKGDKTKNTRTIVMGADRAILDGFTISDAYGTDQPRMHLVPADILKNDMVVGGGMRNFMTSPIVRNCVFKNNFSPKGGAVYNVHKAGADQATFVNVDFIDNVAQVRGGAVSNDLGAMPRFINCRFIGNKSMDKGGGLYNDFAASPQLLNCQFIGNSAVSAGAIGNDGGSAPLLVNVTIKGNKASSGLGPGLYQGTGANSNPVLINSVVDNIYNWHEDVVSEVGSSVPRNQTVPLGQFLAISDLKGQLQPGDLKSVPAYGRGYRAGLDGSVLLKNRLVDKLVQIYAKNDGAIKYRGEYTRPSVARKAVSTTVLYVAPTSSAKIKDGLSWATALTDLQAAIELASVSKSAVWVKAGTYRPAKKQDRIAAFILYDDVKLYGGFAGTEAALEQRPSSGNQTILSAKAAGGGYRYPHVLYGANNVVLDGLTLRDGSATGFTYNGKGGGLLAYHAGKTFLPHDNAVGFAMTIQNCRFEQNTALEGGAIYAFGKAALSISNTTFENNRAIYGGAVVDREGTKSTYQRSSFNGNVASQDGGAAYEDYGSHVEFDGTQFMRNGARHQGGAIYEISRASQLEATVVSVNQCKFSGNTALAGASIYNLDGSTLTVKGSKYPAKSVHNPTPSAKP